MENTPADQAEAVTTLTVKAATRRTGLSRTEIYRLLAAGSIQAVKSGKRTLIVWSTLKTHLDGLPAATFRPPR